MRYILAIFLATTLLPDMQDLVGIYEYKSAKESENQYIVFDEIDGQLKGLYFGAEAGKGHGTFFYAADITNLKIDKEGNIEFEIGERRLFETTQFKIVKTEKQKNESVGHSRWILKYKGQIKEDKILLTCDSESQDCWTKEMTFEKVK